MGRIPVGRGGSDGLDTDRVGGIVMMSTKCLVWALVIVAIIFIGNLGGLWLISTF